MDYDYSKWNGYKIGNIHWVNNLKNHKSKTEYVNYVISSNIDNILEIGIGEAIEAQRIKEHNIDINYTVLDVADVFLENAKSLGFRAVKGEMHNTGFKDDEFDLVYLASILEHSPDLDKTLKELKRISKTFYFTMFKWGLSGGNLKSEKKKGRFSTTFNINKLFKLIEKYGYIDKTFVCTKKGKVIKYSKYLSKLKSKAGVHRNGNYLSIIGRFKDKEKPKDLLEDKKKLEKIPKKKLKNKDALSMDFTTTAVARPDIVDKTYASFSKNLKGLDLKDCRLFINVDPVPSGVNRNEVIEVAEKYFGEVYPNYPEKPNFTAAYNWVWSSAQTEYIFNLEDDWLLLKSVSVPKLLEYFKQHPKLMEVALRAYRYSYNVCPLSPCILHERYYKAVAGNLNEKSNPESQLRGKKFGIKMPAKEFKISEKGKLVVYPGKIILKDIGRHWLRKSNFKKPARKGKFIMWEEKGIK